LAKKTFLTTILIYYAVSLIIVASGYFFPAETELAIYLPILLSILLLIPIYVWQRKYRGKKNLPEEIGEKDAGRALLGVFALFTLAMSIRIPSVLLFSEPYEKIPLIYLLVLTILLVEKIDLEAFGFKTRNLGKSLLYGLVFFICLNGLASAIRYVSIYALNAQTPVQSFDIWSSLLTMPFMTFCVGVSEEGLFRGYIQTHLQNFYSSKEAILVQAILFGGWHFVWNLFPFSPLEMAQYVSATFFIGLLFGYFYSKTKNLTPLIFAHGLWNSIPPSIIQSDAAKNFVSALTLPNQIMLMFLPFVISALITVIFTKYLVREV